MRQGAEIIGKRWSRSETDLDEEWDFGILGRNLKQISGDGLWSGVQSFGVEAMGGKWKNIGKCRSKCQICGVVTE